MADEKTITVFCANEQADTEHTLDVDGAGEIILTCACGRFLKLPADTDSAGLKAYVAEHKIANEGQVSAASLQAKVEKLIASF